MTVDNILIIWGVIDTLCTCHVCSLKKEYGPEIAPRAISPIFALFSFILFIGIIVLLWDSGKWWYPAAIHAFLIAPVVRGIYNV